MAPKPTTKLSQHIKNLREISKDVESNAVMVLLEAGEAVRQDAMESIRRGTIRGAGHIPAPAGQPPNGDTGRLETSIVVQLRKTEKSVTVAATAPYAAAQEFGTVRAAARPFLRPALRRNKGKFVQALTYTARGVTGVRVFRTSRSSIEGADRITGRTNDTP